MSSSGTAALPTLGPRLFCTVADALYFPGAVALLNSLRLVGHREPIVVLDNGLTADQRARLEAHATVVALPRGTTPYLLKPYLFSLGVGGTIALIDSDMIVCASLDETFDLAESGQICVLPDHEDDQGRWFAEWEPALSLTAPLRRETYVNAGFVVFSVEQWPSLLERWWRANSAIPPEELDDRSTRNGPFLYYDQDALNAILMSEIPREAISVLPYGDVAYPDRLGAVRLVDEERLACSFEGQPVSILHHSGGPKVWLGAGRGYRYSSRNAYLGLLPRVVFAADVPLRLRPSDVPWWLRPTRIPWVGRARYWTMHLAFISAKRGRDAVRAVRRRLPAPSS